MLNEPIHHGRRRPLHEHSRKHEILHRLYEPSRSHRIIADRRHFQTHEHRYQQVVDNDRSLPCSDDVEIDEIRLSSGLIGLSIKGDSESNDSEIVNYEMIAIRA